MLEQGVLVASGTHGELMAGNEPYRDLWQLQPAPAPANVEEPEDRQPDPRAADLPRGREADRGPRNGVS
jgi:hypothetical protein